MELKPIYQIIFIVLILILFTVIIGFIIYLSNEGMIINNAKNQIRKFLEHHKNDILKNDILKNDVLVDHKNIPYIWLNDENILLHVNHVYFYWKNNEEQNKREELKSYFSFDDINDYGICNRYMNDEDNKKIEIWKNKVKNILYPAMKVKIIFENREYDMTYVKFEELIKLIDDVKGYYLFYDMRNNLIFKNNKDYIFSKSTNTIEVKETQDNDNIEIYLILQIKDEIKLDICKGFNKIEEHVFV